MPFLEAVGATSTNKTFTIAYAFMTGEEKDNYLFVLQFIRGLFQTAVAPLVIVTDRCIALKNAVEDIFPQSKHHLCRFHIEKCVLARALKQKGFNQEYAEAFKFHWNWVTNALTEGEFEYRWMELQTRYSRWPALANYCWDTWVFPHDKQILSHHIDHYIHYGSYTTNR